MSRVKICGLMRMEDILAVNSALPDYIGFVFAPGRRQISIETASVLKKNLDQNILAVGVFVNQQIEVISNLYNDGIIDIAQLHGDEDSNYIKRLKTLCPCPVIKAVGIKDSLPEYARHPPADFIYNDYYLFDTLSAQRGGTGKTFNWSALKNYKGLPFFLAGGLNTANIPRVISSLNPFCIDVSSGAETDGKKDKYKISEITELVKNF
ncbi:MAG: phosphoribosylanthranilate isomerase [Treponema sp.]|nr:phosphoribosylanthranilate isomerase [Treponema sp.]